VARWSPPPAIEEFRLERSLGRGASAEVWLATDTLLDRPVALKIALGAVSGDARARFLVEARALARLHHPNLIAIHGMGTIDGRPFLVTELLVGSSLAELVLPLDPARALRLALELSLGLAAMHRAGVLHRDIKAANCFALSDGSVKLIDLGLAKLADGADAPGGGAAVEPDVPVELDDTVQSGKEEIVGTPFYMAPEIWRGEPASGRSDVYALGVLLHELLTGQRPFVADSMRALREHVLTGPPPAPPPGPLGDLVRRCLAREVHKRPTAEELRDSLEALVGDAPEPADDQAQHAGANPYRGLHPFGPEHGALFFGRETDVGAVLAELGWARFVLVVGPSGAGKSSLVRAAVGPRVARGALGPGSWRVVTLSPGARPVAALAHALAPLLGRPAEMVAEGLRGSPSWLVAELTVRASERVLLVVDQLEELCTLADEPERRAYAELLAALVRSAAPARVVATLRSDFLGRLEDLGELRALALPAMVVLRPLAPEALRRVIREPALRRGVEVDDELVERLVREAGGSLPLLSFALGRMWEGRKRDRGRLGVQALEALRLDGALAAHADGVLARLDEGERRAARRILVALVTAWGTRARREEAELLHDDPQARRALAALVEGRLVVASGGDEGAAYALAHEALIAGWPTLSGWLASETATREARARVTRAAAEWRRLGGRGEGLWAEAQLASAPEPAQLDAEERAFVEASRRRVAGLRRRRLLLFAGVPLALLLASGAAWGAALQRRHAVVARAVAEAQQAWGAAQAAQVDADALRAGALAAFERDELGDAEARWQRTLVAEDRAEGQRRQVAGLLDRALALDAGDGRARALYADVTVASLLAAERRRPALVPALRSRLALYDDGSRAARLDAPARLSVDSEPSGAELTLRRYLEGDDHRLAAGAARALAAGAEVTLPPGSYLVTAASPGRYPTRAPVVLARGAEVRVRVVVPPAAAVPAGFIYVPAGRVHYGADDDEETRVFLTHQPGHDVDLHAFFIARLEVQNADYLAFLGDLPDAERARRLLPGMSVAPDGGVRLDAARVQGRRCGPDAPCADWPAYPVAGASRDDGEAYAAWLARRLPGARLCSDREWERAARGADGRRYPHGDMDYPSADDACTLLTYHGDAERAALCPPGTHPASASPFGVEDLVGSLWEWTAGPADVAHRELGIYRGGDYRSGDLSLWLPNRGYARHDTRNMSLGLRICADAPGG
jgi:formylglycine-generating enzyme required for sulfatase activity